MAPKTAADFKTQLPSAVRKQSRAADRMHKKAYTADPAAPAAGPDGAVTPEPAASPDVVTLATQQPQAPAPAPDPGPTPAVEPTPEPTPAPAAAAPPAPAPAPSSEPGEWEQRYKSLQGMMEREAKENKRLTAQLEGMQATIAAITRVQESTPEPGAQDGPPSPNARRRLKQEDVDTYGEDMINVVRAAAFDEIMPELDKLRSENTQLKQQLGGVANRTAQSESERIDSFLDTNVSGWRKLNTDPLFLEWLSDLDVFTGVPRQELMDGAAKDFNAPRIAAFFQAYLNESQALRGQQEAPPAAPPQRAPQAQAPRSGPIVDKTSLVAPGTPAQNAGAGAAVDSEEPQFFTQKQIATFYREVQQGKWKSRPAEKDKLERAIHAAAIQGRVRA